MFETIVLFVRENLVASYGAAVGTLALLLNYMRYRHTLSGTRIKLGVELITVMDEKDFEDKVRKITLEMPEHYGNSHTSEITHKIKVRNLGAVTAHIQDAWIETKDGRINGTLSGHNSSIYTAVSEKGNIEIPPRSSIAFSCFSKVPNGYLKPTRSYVVDATGSKWRSRWA